VERWKGVRVKPIVELHLFYNKVYLEFKCVKETHIPYCHSRRGGNPALFNSVKGKLIHATQTTT
jgi:hypothetical protein